MTTSYCKNWGVSLAYSLYGGDGFKKTALVMLHGRGSNRQQFAEIAQLLSEQGHTVLILDLPGHGDSSRPLALDSHQWTPAALAGVVHEVIVHVLREQEYVLFGHSLGGVIALECVAKYPTTHLQQVVVMGTHLELTSVPKSMIALDQRIRRVCGNTWVYSAYIAAAWCRCSPKTFKAFRAVFKYRRGHDVERDLAIIRKIPRYDYRPALEYFEQHKGVVSMIVAKGDWLINPGLKESLAFMGASAKRKVITIVGGHYSHLSNPLPLVAALRLLLR